jgi:RNA polymerase sigma factor (sigma-70 family)
MTTGRQSQVFQQLRQAVLARDGAGLTDAELMAHFVGQRDGAALEALIRRHGSMVWSVCRRVLSNEQDAEDAFQASFLVFVRKAASIRAREQVGNWLYGVAYRTALKARTTDARRRAKERRAAEMPHPQAEVDAGWSELLPLLDQELSCLPDKYRTAIVLCELEGRPRKEAARQLGIPEGTLSSRLATGRRMLAKRLGRPGLALSAGALATAATVVPAPLMASTVKAVTMVAAGQAVVAGVVSVRFAALAEGVVKAMFLSKLSVGAALLMVFGVLAAGAGGVAYCAVAADPKPQPQTPPAAAISPKGNNAGKDEVKKGEAVWGEAVDGVQARIRTPKVVWTEGEAPTFSLDLRNQGKRTPHGLRIPFDSEIELDGTWYLYGGPIDFKAADTPLPPGRQIDDWVKVTPDAIWVNESPGPVRGPNDHLSLPPGKHTVRLAFKLTDEKAIRPISGPIEIEIVTKGESAWGEAVDGVQARLRLADESSYTSSGPEFNLDMRNRGEHAHKAYRMSRYCEIEFDGEWYLYGGLDDLSKRISSSLEPGKEEDNWVNVSLADGMPWVRKTPDRKRGDPLRDNDANWQVAPGEHTLRIAFEFEDGTRPVSPQVEIKVGRESAWGEAVDGVQARIRTPRDDYKAGEAPTFTLDLRNQGKKTPDQRRVPVDCQIEVDKVWYSYEIPSGPYVTLGELLKPGSQINDWTTVKPDEHWVSLTPEKKRFPLPPGKHTIRIAYQLQGTTPAIRPISGPIEIEISEKGVDGAKAPPTGEAAPPAGDVKETPARRAVDIRKMLEEPIKYELTVDITLDMALDELLIRQGTSWRVNAPAFVNQGQKADFIKKVPIKKIDAVDGVSRRTILELMLSKIESKSGDGQAVAVVRPDGVEITTRRAYLDEFFPGRKSSYLPPLVNAVFDKVPLSEALAELRRTTGSNVVLAGYLGKEAETKVSANLTSVPLDAAVTVLADMADLKCVRLGNVYYVTSRERARLLETEEQERRLKEEKEEDVPAKPQADKADAKK